MMVTPVLALLLASDADCEQGIIQDLDADSTHFASRFRSPAARSALVARHLSHSDEGPSAPLLRTELVVKKIIRRDLGP